jgi:hypothetical protein
MPIRIIRSSIPEGVKGDYKVERFQVDRKTSRASAWRAKVSWGGRGFVYPGTYTRLVQDGHTWMSDTPDECFDLVRDLGEAKGTVRLNGLGLGLSVEYLMTKEEVDKVIAVEISKEVIELVVPTLERLYGERLEVRNENVLRVKPGMDERYDFVYHDIWQNIGIDNLREMEFLTRRYASKAAFQACWCRRECEEQRRLFAGR